MMNWLRLCHGHLAYRCRSRYAGAGEEPYILVLGVWGERHWVTMPVVKQANYTYDQLKPKSPYTLAQFGKDNQGEKC